MNELPECEMIPSIYVPGRYYIYRDGTPAAIMQITVAQDGSTSVLVASNIEVKQL